MKSRLKCPKCKYNSLNVTELWKNHSIEFIQINGILDRVGNLNPGGPYRVVGECKKCGHIWTARSVYQIDYLEEDEKF